MENSNHGSDAKGKEALMSLDLDTVGRFLEDLAEKDPRIRERVEALYRSSDASALSDYLKERLDHFHALPESLGFRDLFPLARDCRAFLSDTSILMAPLDAGVALDLVDRFLDMDRVLEGLEDGGGPLQSVFGDACDLWLTLAAESGLAMDWSSRILEHFLKDRFGVRVNLLRHADILLPADQLEKLAERMVSDAEDKAMDAGGEWYRYRLAMGLRYLSQVLRDPELMARSVTLVQSEPSPRQIGDIVQAYLDYEGPEAALAWLAGDWGDRELERLDLLDKVYGAMDDREMLFQIRRERYGAQPSADYLLALLDVCDADEKEAFLASAPETARHTTSLYSGLNLLLSVNAVKEAERLLAERLDALSSYDYTAVLRIQGKFDAAGSPLGQSLCFRALVEGILDEARFRAYGKAVAYCETLEVLDSLISSYGDLPNHLQYLSWLRKTYGDKRVFWQRMDGHSAGDAEQEDWQDASDSSVFVEKRAEKQGTVQGGMGYGHDASLEVPSGRIVKKVPRETSSVPSRKVPRGTPGGIAG
ncbi:hypothetical protein OOT00_12470 [Desulfobotulus sp. H1]|uniref:Uncharacterized protein n=1 Tax=Desulfobotulus pelophilus TaxID=2823377 RepID=A0ABT3NBG0_9BACT|nr:DUF6880 family protein [Desulfobotulus pelophilus]MCW7754797.1 hypothetical protein [Desulfobotulus pelophilus]